MGDGVRLRSTPDTSTSSNILGHFNTGDKVEFTGQKKKQGGRMWAEVIVDGKKGWVAADYLKTAKPGTSGADGLESKDNKPETSETDKANRDENSSGIRFKAQVDKTVEEKDQSKKETVIYDENNLPPGYTKEWFENEKLRLENKHQFNPPVTPNEETAFNNNNFSYTTSDGTKITPSNNVFKYFEEYFSSQYNTGKTTVDFVVNEAALEALHDYLYNGVKNAARTANIGVGIWNKQVQNDLKWIDDMFGKSSNFAKALKTLPVITIGVDTVLGVKENIVNNAGAEETISDAVVDVVFGTGGTAASWVVSGLVGGIPGAIVGVIAGLAFGYLTDGVELGGKTFKEHIDSLF